HRPVPLATSYPISTQNKMQAAHHWDVLADHVAGRLANTLELTFPNAAVKPALYVCSTEEQEKTPFGEAFANLLTTKLVQRGLVVVNSPDSSNVLTLNYDMQVLHHKDRGLLYPPPGTFTGLGALAWLVAYGVDNWGDPELAVLPISTVADIYATKNYFFPGETNTEVIITTTVTMGQQHIFGDTNIYYVNTGDADHYEAGGQLYQVVGCPQQTICP
ncbi:MAG: hypothetical protein SVR94_19495, partial [Pseudomonadota bacterium]|nr:hypothetical protein [Pseudomonadota bacterium]